MTAVVRDRDRTVLLAGEDTDGRVALVETYARQGFDPPFHVHSHEDELIYVLEGRVTFYRNGERFACTAGMCLFLPRGSEHAFSIESPHARLLVLLTPAGLERCHCDQAEPDESLAEWQKFEQLVATAARFGISITGPTPHGDVDGG